MPSAEEHRLLPAQPFHNYAAYRAQWKQQATEKLQELSAADTLKVVQASGLRGRGGAGFPTGTKWASVANHECATRQVVCNAAEGEPGTFKDRWLIRHNPFAVVEGMLVAAYVVGATDLFIAVKASFVREAARIEQAIEEMGEAGLLRLVNVKLIRGPEEYLFGEERALLEVIEGGEPLPRETHNPPYEKGLFATATSPNPAVVNNAETFAHVPGIIRAGADSFRSLGTADTPGSLLFTVSGAVVRPGVYELEAGITLERLFYEVAGGPREGRSFRAALSGVASPPIMANRFNTKADFGSLRLIGSGLGSAGFVLVDDATNMLRVTQSVARFLYVESCNQCSACKHGLRTASEALDAMFDSDEPAEDLRGRALYGARRAPQANRCYLPVQGSLVVPGLLNKADDAFATRATSQPWPIPKLTDFDTSTGRFLIDEPQQRKTPEWLYDEVPPIPAAAVSARPATQPLDVNEVGLSVQLPPEVAAALRERVQQTGRRADDLVAEALRSWLDSA